MYFNEDFFLSQVLLELISLKEKFFFFYIKTSYTFKNYLILKNNLKKQIYKS